MTTKPVQDLESRLVQAYEGEADAMLEEIVELLGRQSWPNE